MQQIIKQACPSRQLFENINFAFMKIVEKSKIFIKAKLTVSKSCLLRPACFKIYCILGDAHSQNLSFLRGLSTEFIFLNFSEIATYPGKLGNQN